MIIAGRSREVFIYVSKCRRKFTLVASASETGPTYVDLRRGTPDYQEPLI